MPRKKPMKRTSGGLPHPDVITDEQFVQWIIAFLKKQRGQSHEVCSLPEKAFRSLGLRYRGRYKMDVLGRMGALIDDMEADGLIAQYHTKTITKVKLLAQNQTPPSSVAPGAPASQGIRKEIMKRLLGVERKEHVKILYACESGSRAWGFASRDSDWDVRFVYARPVEWYLSINTKRRDVIELPIKDDLDINGWDVRKALGLFRKSNPPLLEWLRSPIVYQQHTGFADQLRELLPTYYSFQACHYHYLSMAKSNYREYLRGDQVRLKKYLYVLRPLLAVNWMEQGRGRVPVEFSKLLDCSPNKTVSAEIEDLLKKKTSGEELDQGPRIEPLNHYIENELERLGSLTPPPRESYMEVAPLDQIFHNVLREAWDDEE